MEQINDILNSGAYSTFKVEKPITVGDLLKDLNLENKYFGILINGKKAEKDTVITSDSEVVILPNIAGGRI